MTVARLMRINRLFLGLTGASFAVVGALAPIPSFANSAAMEYFTKRADRTAVPKLLTQDERGFYGLVFKAIDRNDWKQVQDLLATRPEGPLNAVAKAQFYAAAGSPKVDGAALSALLVQAPELPWADQLGRLAMKRGVTALPALPGTQEFSSLPRLPARSRPRGASDGTMPDSIASAISDKIKYDDPDSAKLLLDGIDATLSPAARAEWRQKVGWSYFIEGHDADARKVALSATEGSGAWVGEALWTAGLAAWRSGNSEAAADSFEKAAVMAENTELTAAAWFWASRAHLRARAPQKVAAALRNAVRQRDSLYGMIAAEALGLRAPQAQISADFSSDDWQNLRNLPNVRSAVALAEIGEDSLADEVLRYQARIGDPSHYAPLSRLAREIGLPGTQLWMAYNAPVGARADESARFPAPKWTPANGWQVDPALIFAHTLQESVFRPAVVSPAGARGLMQIMPAAARDHAGELGVSGNAADLSRPTVNLAFGQAHLRTLSQSSATGGLLPKVIAAYNAGPQPVDRWNTQIRDNGDPLLWMESIPYWETRGYVATVLRNYWMYEKQAGGPSESRLGLAQGMWPRFPGLSGAGSVRVAYNGLAK